MTERLRRTSHESGLLALTEWRPLSEPAIPDAPQAAGPVVPETEIGAGGVPVQSGMPGTWKRQPARQSSRIQGEQATVERHVGFDFLSEGGAPRRCGQKSGRFKWPTPLCK